MTRDEAQKHLADLGLTPLPDTMTRIAVDEIEMWEFDQDESIVDGMFKTLKHGGALPPFVVSDTPEDGDCKYRILDGHHRLMAYHEAEIVWVLAFVISGDSRDELMMAFSLDDVSISELVIHGITKD